MRLAAAILSLAAAAALLYFSDPTEAAPPAGRPSPSPTAEAPSMADTSDTAAESDAPRANSGAQDPYLWLEEVEGTRALDQVRAWNAEGLARLQNDPRYAALEADALAIVNAQDKLAYGAYRGGWVYNFWQDETHVRGLVRRAPLDAYLAPSADGVAWETLLDVDALAAAEDENWVYKGSTCLPPHYERCILTLSRGGKDAAVRREWDHGAKAFVEGGFTLPETKGGVAWVDEDTLLAGADWGEDAAGPTITASGYPFVLKRVRRGQPMAEAEEVFRGAPTDVGVSPVRLSTDGTPIMLAWRSESFFERSLYWLPALSDPAADPAPVMLPLPRKSGVAGWFKGHMLVSLQEPWTPVAGGETFPEGALVAFSWDAFAKTRTLPAVELVFAPGPRQALGGVAFTRSKMLLQTTDNVRGAVDVMDWADGAWSRTRLALPELGSVGVASAYRDSDVAFVNHQGYLTPDTLAAFDLADEAATPDGPARVGAQAAPARFAAEGLTVRQFEAVSSDGAAIPYFVVHKQDIALDGANPTLLYGYGGFEIPLTPAYSGVTGKLWLERGGVYVVANIRGGGEFGPAWHQAGLKTKRQTVFDDFIAVAEDVIARGISSPRRLGIAGGSNGGLLVGAMYVQRPELFNAVVCVVPLLDMLRYHRLLAGASWIGEYGDPDIPEERAFLETISPYHNVTQERAYPEILFLTSTKDDRVHPGHARKMAARLEAFGHDFVYYENIDGGHAAAANLQEAAKRAALQYTFLAQRLMD